VGGVLLTVTSARAAASYPAILLPGEAVCDEARCLVRTGDGAVELVHVEIDGQPADPRGLRALMESAARCGPSSG
jgi:hypothetical protein